MVTIRKSVFVAGGPAVDKMMSIVRTDLNGAVRRRYHAALLIVNFSALLLAVSANEIIFQDNFETTNIVQQWGNSALVDAGFKSQQSLGIESKPGGRGSIVQKHLPLENLRGVKVRCSAIIRAQDVSAPPDSWNGIKFLLIIQSPGGTAWPQAQVSAGTFDWQKIGFETRIPADATNVTLTLGLEKVAGEVWFDDVKIAVVKSPARPKPFPVLYKGHSLPRLRGAMVSPQVDAESLRVLGRDWNANLIRWQLIRYANPHEKSSLDAYDQWLEDELKKLDVALIECEKDGLYVVIALMSPPEGIGTRGYAETGDGWFTEKAVQGKFIEAWKTIARRYQKTKSIWGYDLANEPIETVVEDDCDDWQTLSERAARAIRAIDPERAIIVEPPHGGGPDGFSDFVPLRVSNVVYSVHMYLPHAFTHQNVHGQTPSYRYPGLIAGKTWDKAQLEKALQPVIDFQRNYNVHIYVGEFSAVRWAPDNSAARYLSDLIDIFETHDWDWTYHAFREWHGWSAEHGPDRENTNLVSPPTARQELLRKWFVQNKKP